MAPRRHAAEASYGFSAVLLLSAVVSGSDRLGTIDPPLVPEARKVGASTHAKGADRPEAYPTGHEKS
jgi:hypothetical protein